MYKDRWNEMNGFHKPVTYVNGRTDVFARVADCQMT
jgi:hypothetical protein